jgi:hypothetical protein
MAELWYYTREGRQMDPVSEPELRRLAAAGDLKPTDLVWSEGMPQWIRASAAKGLFADARLSPADSKWKDRVSASPDADVRQVDAEPEDDRPRRRRRAQEYDDDDYADYDDDRPRRRRQGMSTGAKVALIGAGIAAVLVVGVILIVVLTTGSNTRSFNLGVNEKATYNIRFQQGKTVEIWVKSTGQSDVDLFVYPPNNANPIAIDEGMSSDCYVRFVAPATQSYKVVVWNRLLDPKMNQNWRNKANSGTLTFKESDQVIGQAPAPPVAKPAPMPQKPFPQPPIAQPPPQLAEVNLPGTIDFKAEDQLTINDPIDTARPLKCRCKTYIVNLAAGVRYTIVLESRQFDSYLRLEDEKGLRLAENDDGIPGTLHSRIDFIPPQAGSYRLVATSLTPAFGAFRLTVRH